MAVLLLSMVPFAIVANASRLATIGIWPIFEKGLWHASFGLSIFIVGFDCLKGVNWIVNRLSPRPRSPVASPPSPVSGPRSSLPHLAAGLALVLVLSPWAVQGVAVTPVPLKQGFGQFPLQLGPWEGRHVHIDQEIVAATGADTVLNAEFINPGQGPVSLWIAYYENQKSGASVHSPMSCLTGSGWKTVTKEVVELAPGKPINYVLMNQGGSRMAMYYWYFERGRWLSSDYGHKLGIGLDRLALGRADGALVRLTTPVGRDVEQARERLDGFLRQLDPVLEEIIPE